MQLSGRGGAGLLRYLSAAAGLDARIVLEFDKPCLSLTASKADRCAGVRDDRGEDEWLSP